MTGYADHNFPLFFQVSDALRKVGFSVVNPAENDGDNLIDSLNNAAKACRSWSDYLRMDLRNMTDCKQVVVLPGWRQSQGAKLEVDVARRLGMPVRRWDGEAVVPLYSLVAMSGYARAGKDTAAKILVDDFGYTRVAFADGLREALYTLNPDIDQNDPTKLAWIVDDVGWDVAKVDYPEVRRLQQVMGTEVGRNLVGPNIWVDYLFDRLEDGGKYVISDCRFPNEVDAVESWEGSVWRIRRPGVRPVNGHVSETALDDHLFPVHIDNNGSIDELRSNVASAIRYFR
jgi:hypothetical protein